MKHGVVTDGRTTTYYGNSATRYFASQSALYTRDQEEATSKVEASRGDMRKILIEELEKLGYKFNKKWLKEQYDKEEAEEEEAKLRWAKTVREKMRKHPLGTKSTRSKCSICRGTISKSEDYHDGGVGHRAHVRCCKEPDAAPVPNP